jgi:hypothetical protein
LATSRSASLILRNMLGRMPASVFSNCCVASRPLVVSSIRLTRRSARSVCRSTSCLLPGHQRAGRDQGRSYPETQPIPIGALHPRGGQGGAEPTLSLGRDRARLGPDPP